MLLDEIAADLGISRRRAQALAQSGELRAARLGSMWVVHPEDLADYKLRRKAGRPVSPAVAWQMLLMLSGVKSPETDRMVAFRARKHLLGESIIGKLRRSRRMVGRHRGSILTEDLGEVLESGVLTGASAADGVWFDVVAADAVPKVYLAQSRFEEIMRSLLPLAQSSEPNVEVLIPSDDWVLGLGMRAPDAVIAADLLLDPDPRTRRAAEHHLDSLQGLWKMNHD